MVKVNVDLANKANYGGWRYSNKIEYIVIHYTANDGDTAEGNANWFKGVRNASAHYFVDDDSIVQTVPDCSVAWSVGGDKYPSCSKTGGGKFWNKCTNANSISIELCDTKKDGDYNFTEKTLQNAIDLCAVLMRKYNIPIDRVIRHFDVTGKICPEPFVTYPKQWAAFKERLGEDEMVEKKKIYVEGKAIDMSCILKDDVNFVKLREIVEALGYDVTVKNGNIYLTKKK